MPSDWFQCPECKSRAVVRGPYGKGECIQCGHTWEDEWTGTIAGLNPDADESGTVPLTPS